MAQRRFFDFLARAHADLPALQIVITAGNHDAGARLEALAGLLESLNISVVGTVSRDLALEALEEVKQLLLARAWCVFSSSSASTNVCGFSFPAMTARPPVSPIWRA